MQVVIITQPGRGDVEPFIALALRLTADGHSVTIATRPDFEDLLDQNGVNFAPLGNAYQPFIAAAAEANAMGSGHPINKVRLGIKQSAYVREGLHDDAWLAAQGADAIIYKWPWITPYTIAEKLDIPCVPVMLLPMTPTSEFPSFMIGKGTDRGVLVNRVLWRAPWEAVWQGLRLEDRALRKRLNLPSLPVRGRLPREQDGMPILCEWSPSVLAAPNDWPANHQVTGYWFLDPPPAWRPPDGLVEFLKAGDPPVCIGFGSMVSADRDATLKTILGALLMAEMRAVLLGGWAGIGTGTTLPGTIYAAPSIPHSWLFPQTAAVVHHGGAGTTGAVIRAGVPQVVCPFVADQPSWARLVESLGVGPRHIPFHSLDAPRLAQALREATTDPSLRDRAHNLGTRVRSEDGLGRAAALIADYVQPSALSVRRLPPDSGPRILRL